MAVVPQTSEGAVPLKEAVLSLLFVWLKPIKHPARASSVAALCAALGAELRCGELPLKRGCLLASVASHPFPQVCHRDVARVPCAAFGLPALGPLSVPHTPIF